MNEELENRAALLQSLLEELRDFRISMKMQIDDIDSKLRAVENMTGIVANIAAEVESIDNRLKKVEHFLTGYILQ